jgi:hypothetical protein
VSDSAETSSFPVAADGGGQSDAPAGATSSAESSPYGGSAYGSSAPGTGAGPGSDRPELVVGAAFAGGFLAALILKRIAR